MSDGHSHDDPVKPALKLRNAGVEVMALGIGNHINMEELELMTGEKDLAFENITIDKNVEKFINKFRKNAVGEECEYLRGEQGAQIDCLSDRMQVNTLTLLYNLCLGSYHYGEELSWQTLC